MVGVFKRIDKSIARPARFRNPVRLCRMQWLSFFIPRSSASIPSYRRDIQKAGELLEILVLGPCSFLPT
ncbi:hypothetical protein ACCT02_37955, partial [Rhizobium ruizarguesonis]